MQMRLRIRFAHLVRLPCVLMLLSAGCQAMKYPAPVTDIIPTEQSARVLWQAAASDGAVDAIAFLPDGRHVAIASDSGTLQLCPIHPGEANRNFSFAPPIVKGQHWNAVAVSSNGRWLAAGVGPNFLHPDDQAAAKVYLWDVNTATQQAVFLDPMGEFATLRFSPDGTLLAQRTDSPKQRLTVWKIPDKQIVLSSSADSASRSIFFKNDAATGEAYLCASGLVWRIGDAQPQLVETLDQAPDAMSDDWKDQYFLEGWDGKVVGNRFITVTKDAGILERVSGPVEKKRFLRLVRLAGTMNSLMGACYVRPKTDGGRGLLLVWTRNDILLINLDKNQESVIKHSELQLNGVAVSMDGRMVAGCGLWGAAIWEMPFAGG